MILKKSSFQLLSIAALLCFYASVCKAEINTKEIVKKYGDAVVMVFTMQNDKVSGLGSGFVVEKGGVIATNYHVIENAQTIFVKFKNGNFYDVISVTAYSPEHDVALIRIEGKDAPYPTVKLSDKTINEIGEQVVIIGNPEGLENTVSVGIISQIRQIENNRYIQTDAAISHGSSGGPMFNPSGQVIGMVCSLMNEGQNLNFAVPIFYIQHLLNDKTEIPIETFYGIMPKPDCERPDVSAYCGSLACGRTDQDEQKTKSKTFTYRGGECRITVTKACGRGEGCRAGAPVNNFNNDSKPAPPVADNGNSGPAVVVINTASTSGQIPGCRIHYYQGGRLVKDGYSGEAVSLKPGNYEFEVSKEGYKTYSSRSYFGPGLHTIPILLNQ